MMPCLAKGLAFVFFLPGPEGLHTTKTIAQSTCSKKTLLSDNRRMASGSQHSTSPIPSLGSPAGREAAAQDRQNPTILNDY